ncbi:DUF7547 family protein [Halobellus ordinarius]|uniref:DUF7547 family protein n=1 Tax=Halobellus ordinarius TaxID=3075120 RepID=UPI002880627A|nr:hypothetical protein [Halobellus sp. ZY16]
MSSRDDADRDEADLRVLLDDLETTLSALQNELSAEAGRPPADDQAGDGSRDRRGSTRIDPDSHRGRMRRDPPRPPSLRDLFRFTEQYTLPTVISLLETTIQSLELLRGVLRVADPERSAFDPRDSGSGRTRATDLGDEVTRAGRDAVSGMGRGAVSGLERTLSELQRALSESDLPEEETSRELLQDAQRLSGEVAERLAAAQTEGESERYGYRGESDDSQAAPDTGADAVTIDVTDDLATGRDETQSENSAGGEMQEQPSTEEVEIDVEAELASIKDEVEPRGERDESATDSGSADGVDETAGEEGDVESNEETDSDSPEGNSSDSGDRSADEPDEDES